MTDKTFRIVHEKRRTEKAVLVDLCGVNDPSDDLGRADIWLPLSQITISDNTVTMPAWLSRAKALDIMAA